MYSRFANPIPQAMQRHTGTAWASNEKPCEQRRANSLPTPAEPPCAQAAADALKRVKTSVTEGAKQSASAKQCGSESVMRVAREAAKLAAH